MVNRRRAFTLIELLVVISIIALLISILMPALNSARQHATGAVCLGNQKALIMAYLMYADENDDRIVGSEDDYIGTTTPDRYPWKKVPHKLPGVDDWDGVPVEEKMAALKEGLLWPYLNAIDVYHCPGDRREFTGQTAFCSYSIPGGLNGFPPGKSGWGSYALYKLASLKRPSSKYVFVEESDPRGVNCGVWMTWVQMDVRQWCDPVAIWHSDRSSLAFADGHAEMITWVDRSTVEMAEAQVFGYPVPDHEGTDLDFMKRGFPNSRPSTNMGSPN